MEALTPQLKKMMDNKELEYKKSEGGRFRIKVGGNTVSRELYESEKEKRIQAETKLELLKKVRNTVKEKRKCHYTLIYAREKKKFRLWVWDMSVCRLPWLLQNRRRLSALT